MGAAPARRIVTFALPGGLLCLGALLASRYPPFLHWATPLAGLYAAAVGAGALLLGWRFDRSRLVFITIVLALAGWTLGHLGAHEGIEWRRLKAAVTLLLPLNLLLFALLKERGILTWHGVLRWTLLLAQPAGLWLLFHYSPHEAALLERPLLAAAPHPARLGQPALLAFALALLATAWRGLRGHSAMDSGLFWALILLLYALLVPLAETTVTILFASALFILIAAVMEISHSMAFRDELTGLAGRRALNQALLKLGSRYTVAMLDVDHFKKFNDRYGHDVGDEVLKMVAARMARVGGGGQPYRYGGEEFTVLFPGKDVDDALPHLERLRGAIADAPFTVRGKQRPRTKGKKLPKGSDRRVTITVSIGAAERDGGNREPQAVIKAADKALYRAKKGGRNRVAT